MNQEIQHRGPDAEGIFIDDRITFGHRRLSIIDLSENGKQPMCYKDYIITFNGEIYNFNDLKEILKLENHQFVSHSDTEVVLHAYEEWGFNCVNKFNGMWAFCIYDKKKNILFASRDRFGVKPFYYYFDSEKFIFSSEIKAIRQHKLNLDINKTALNYYFYQKYITGEQTIFTKILKLKPAHNIIFDLKTNHLNVEKYFHLEEEVDKAKSLLLDERLSQIEELITDAVEKRLIADVPVGSFLSGGLDSSLISAIIAKKKKEFKTFSIGFKDKTFNELPYSIQVANYIKTKHNFKTLDIDTNIINYIYSKIDEPFGDASLIPSYLLSKITKENVTVSLSGDAGDEIFGGYDTYKAFIYSKYIPKFIAKFGKLFLNKLPASDDNVSIKFRIMKFFKDYHPNAIIRHLNWMSQTDELQRKELLQENYEDLNHSYLSKKKIKLLDIQLNDIHNYLAEDILKKVDIATMLVSLEGRIPYLDYRLVPLVLSLPDKYKINFVKVKWLLKNIALEYLPHEIINRKKQGFSVPISSWIKKSNLLKEYITENKYFEHNLINKKYVDSVYLKHINNESDYSRLLWLVFVFNFWYKHVISNANSQINENINAQ